MAPAIISVCSPMEAVSFMSLSSSATMVLNMLLPGTRHSMPGITNIVVASLKMRAAISLRRPTRHDAAKHAMNAELL